MSKPADIKKQMEYYLGDLNLSKDDFFRDKILEDKADGYVNLEVFQKCNAIKKMNLTIDEIDLMIPHQPSIKILVLNE